MVNERRWLRVIFVLYFLLAFGYSLLMPIWEAPDEPAHYHIAWHLARWDTYPSQKLNYEANQPRTFYYLGSWVIRALDKFDPHLSDYYVPREYKFNMRVRERRFDWTDQNYRFLLGVYALRWINIVFGACALWLNWMAFCLLAPNKPALRIAAIALAGFTPQYLHIMSSVSNDALGTLAGALIFYLAIRMTNASSSTLAWFSIPLALILPLVTKLSALPAGVALIVFITWQRIFRTKQVKDLVLIGLMSIFIFGIVYLLFPTLFNSAISELTWRLFTIRKGGLPFSYLLFMLRQIVWTYWGLVGWLAVALPVWMLNLLFGMGTIGIISSGRTFIKHKLEHPNFNALLATWLVALFTIAAVIRNGFTTSATRGRFLFPAIGVLSFLMVSGWYDILPERIQRNLPLIVTVFMLSCTLILWLFGVVPVYYQPFLD